MKLLASGASFRSGATLRQLWCHWWPILIGLAVNIAAVGLPADAEAKADYTVHPGGLQLILPVDKDSGNVISVSTNNRRRVQLLVDRASSKIEYSTRGRVSNRRIEAGFGTMGLIRVRLHIVKHPSDPPHEGRCRGRAPSYGEGSYSGAIEFTDPRLDAVRISANHGRVYLVRRFRQVCKNLDSQSNEQRPKGEVSLLTASGMANDREVHLQAFNFIPTEKPARSWGNVSATVTEVIEGVRIIQSTGTPTSYGSFRLSGRGEVPETADIQPPKPFFGHAKYSRGLEATPSWTGDLNVDPPVGSPIPFTGFGYNAVLCRGFSVFALKRCLLSPFSARSRTSARTMRLPPHTD